MKCKVCGHATRRITLQNMKADYHYCEACDFISKDKNAYISQQQEMKIYGNHHNSYEDDQYVEYFRKYLQEAVFPFSHQGKKGLDFGSGPSPVLATLLIREYEYHMDIYDCFYSPSRMFEGKKYDLITSTEVVEHLKEPLEYFLLFNSLLEKEGILAVMTQFHPENDILFQKWHYVRDRSHLSFYTPKTMKAIGNKTGLEVIFHDNIKYVTFKKKI